MAGCLAQRLLDELHEIMGGAEKSTPLSDLMETSELASRVRVSMDQVLPAAAACIHSFIHCRGRLVVALRKASDATWPSLERQVRQCAVGLMQSIVRHCWPR